MSRISKEGLPEFFVKDIPAVSLADIKVTRPEIYYGELSNEYVIVKTKVPEFSYPTATGNINTTYAGKGRGSHRLRWPRRPCLPPGSGRKRYFSPPTSPARAASSTTGTSTNG